MNIDRLVDVIKAGMERSVPGAVLVVLRDGTMFVDDPARPERRRAERPLAVFVRTPVLPTSQEIRRRLKLGLRRRTPKG